MISAEHLADTVRANADVLNALPADHQTALMRRIGWLNRAGAHQIEPVGDRWTVWLLLAGRGAGKTRCAAEWIWWQAWSNPGTRWLVSAPTSADVRDVCYEGDSGLMTVVPQQLVRDYNKSHHELNLVNGSIIKGIPASEPARFRGPQFHGGWCDELAAWEYIDDAWDMIQFGMRLGQNPQIICTTTPKPKTLILDLIKRNGEDVAYTTATTYANINNLAPTFKKQILQYEGTNLGRQEIYAEIIDPEESGIVKRSWMRYWPPDQDLPRFDLVIQSYDLATSEKTHNDPTACTAWGVFKDADGNRAIMLLDAWEERLLYPDVRKRIIEDSDFAYGTEGGSTTKASVLLIEDKSAGISLIQDLQAQGLNATAYNPGRSDKTQRLNLVAPLFKSGKVHLITDGDVLPDWAQNWLLQLCTFPQSRHDDLVDTTSQALQYMVDSGCLGAESATHDYSYRTTPNPYSV